MKKKDGNDKKQSYIMTRETLGMTILLFCALVLIMLLTNNLVFASIGSAICTFLYGTFGYASYLVVALLAYLGFWLVFEKRLTVRLRSVCIVSATVFVLFLLFHSVSTRGYSLESYGKYLSLCYTNAARGYAGYTFGGVISALFVYPFAKISFIAAYIIFSVLAVFCGYLSYLVIRNAVLQQSVSKGKTKIRNVVPESDVSDPLVKENTERADKLYSVNENYEIVDHSSEVGRRAQTAVAAAQTTETVAPEQNLAASDGNKFSSDNLGRKILFENGEFAAESYRRNMIFDESSYFNHPVHNDGDYLSSFSSSQNKTPAQNTTYTDSYADEIGGRPAEAQTPSYIYGDQPVQNFGAAEEPVAEEEVKEEQQPSENYGDANRRYEEEFRAAPAQPTERIVPLRTENENFAKQENSSRFDDWQDVKAERRGREFPSDTADFSRETGSERVSRTSVSETPERDELSVRPQFTQQEEARGRFGSEAVEDNGEEHILRRSEETRESSQRTDGNSLFNLFSSSNSRIQTDRVQPDVSRIGQRGEDRSNASLFDDENDGQSESAEEEINFNTRGLRVEPSAEELPTERNNVGYTLNDPNGSGNSLRTNGRPLAAADGVGKDARETAEPQRAEKSVQEKPAEPPKPKHVWKKYVRPTLDLLDDYPENNNVNTGEIEDSKNTIVETLNSFRIASHISNVIVGPAITRYDVVIEDRTNIKNALKYRESIAMALMKENVNCYLNYSRGAISIEVPNSSRCTIGLKSMLASSPFINCKNNTLTFALGKNVEGQVVCPDITKMPHLLVAGTTGSGKSICLSSLIVSLLYKYGPEELRFILVDPKQVEFIPYDKLPHLMINEIIFDVDKSIKALNWAIKEMERRYQLFKEMTEHGVATKNLTEYNAHLPEGEEKLPKIVIILDEFGDLMMQAKKDIETKIIRLVQKARACGIHLILATQRPSVDCITGLIKSNLPTRIGFKVNSFDDSRTIFDIGGAEKLLGRGDMYFRSTENPDLARIQGCFIDSHEVQKVTDFIKQHNETYFDQSVSDFINTVEEPEAEAPAGDDSISDGETKIDDTFIKALKFCVTSNQASVSMIQRRFPVGYIKACKIIDWMENMNYVTQSEGSKPRKVLLSKEEFFKTYGEVDD